VLGVLVRRRSAGGRHHLRLQLVIPSLPSWDVEVRPAPAVAIHAAGALFVGAQP
jgi:hypothetical protein